MLRLFSSVSRLIPAVISNVRAVQHVALPQTNSFIARTYTIMPIVKPSTLLLSNSKFTEIVNNIQCRGLKFSRKKGKRRSVRAVRLRFYRLHWGAWIRRIAGCKKRIWKKSAAARRRVKNHVLCNSTQSYLLDKMAGKYWTKRRYYVDDPYEPYHSREEHPITASKPKFFEPPYGETPNC